MVHPIRQWLCLGLLSFGVGALAAHAAPPEKKPAAGADGELPPSPADGAVAGAAAAAGPMRGDPVTDHLFPPDFVLQHESRLTLTPEQKQAIEADLKQTKESIPQLQQQLQQELKSLGDLLQEPTSDAAGLLAQMDKILDTERDAKRSQLGMLIRVRSQLTAAQRAEAVKIREEAMLAQHELQIRIQGKLEKLNAAATALARQGKSPQELLAMMQGFDPLVQQGKITEAEALLDQVLERMQPPPAPNTFKPLLPEIKPAKPKK